MSRQSLIFSLLGAWIPMLVLGLTKSYVALEQPCDGDRIWSVFNLEQQIPIPEIVGAYIFCFLAEICGRKYSILALNIPIVLSCAIFEFSCKSIAYTAANIIRKLSYGAAITILPIYIGEISVNKIRGCLISILFTAHLLGKYLQQFLFALVSENSGTSLINYGSTIICIITSIIFAANAIETPSYYIQQQKIIIARETLEKIRNPHVDIDHELDELVGRKKNEDNSDKLIMPCLGSTGWLKSCIIMVTLLVFQNLVEYYGNAAHYSLVINSDLIGLSKIQPLTGIVVCGSSILCSIIVDRIGRLGCLLISSLIMVTIQSILLILTSTGKVDDVYDYHNILLLSFYLFQFSANAIGPISFVFRGELFPMKVKMILSATSTAVSLVSNFVMVIYLYEDPLISTNRLLLISVISFLFASIFVKLFYPETKGKSLNEIQSMLNRNN